jgi:hypothetical protein
VQRHIFQPWRNVAIHTAGEEFDLHPSAQQGADDLLDVNGCTFAAIDRDARVGAKIG